MTVPVQQVIQAFAGNGSARNFVISNFVIALQSDGVTPALLLYYVSPVGVVEELTLGSDYTVDLATSTIALGFAPLTGGTVFALSNLAAEQPDQFLNEGFLPATVEAALDYLALTVQQLLGALGIIPGPYTVATLPTNPQPFQTAWVSDATSNTRGAAPVGGGTVTAALQFNPVNGWVIS